MLIVKGFKVLLTISSFKCPFIPLCGTHLYLIKLSEWKLTEEVPTLKDVTTPLCQMKLLK